MFDHEIKSYACRVAFAMQTKRATFSEEEKLFIEAAYHVGEPPADCAHFLEFERGRGMVAITEDEE